jgi:phosphoglycolate phosphatase
VPDTKLLIFDLDGTLIDSKRDLVEAVNAARRSMGLGPLDNETVASYVGNGAPILIRRAMGPEAGEADCAKALEYFIAYYTDHRLDHTTLYPGVRPALDQLYAAGHRLAVLTNKPVRISRAIVDGLGLKEHFFQIYGGNSFEQKKPHPIGVETLMAEAGIAASRTIMIGDSGVDIQTARNAGIPAVGVTYGFQPESLDESPPDYRIDDLRELLPIVNNGSRQICD